MIARSEGHHERAITAERTRISAREDRCPRESMPRGSLPARIAVCKDRWGDNSRCGKCRCARGRRACARPSALSHLEACGKNRRSICCHALCGYAYGTWYCKMTGLPLFCGKNVCCARSAGSSQDVEKAKTYRIGSKSKFLFNVFNLQAVLLCF